MKRHVVVALALVVGLGMTLPLAQSRNRRQLTPGQAAQRAAAREAAFVRSRLTYMYQHPGVTVAEDTPLTAEPDSDDVFPAARLVRFSDGASGVEVSLRPRVNVQDEEQNSFIVADRSRKTYRTFHFESSDPTTQEKNRVRQHLRRSQARNPAPDPWGADTPILRNAAYVPRTLNGPAALRPMRAARANAAMQYSGCWGYYYAAIWTVEAALQATALDYIEADWGDSFDDWWGWGNINAWAANPVSLPPPFNTHWFIDWEYPYFDPFPYWGTAWSQDDAQFHNDDFPFNIGRVYTNAGGYIDYEYGAKWGGVYWYASGSWTASYLYGQLQAGGYDGCYYGF